MSRFKVPKKLHPPERPDYIDFQLRCPLCVILQQQSKKFGSPYQLKYHLTTYHDSEDTIQSGISVNDAYQTVISIVKAFHWRMFLDVT